MGDPEFEVCNFTECYIRHEILKLIEDLLDNEKPILPGSEEHAAIVAALDA